MNTRIANLHRSRLMLAPLLLALVLSTSGCLATALAGGGGGGAAPPSGSLYSDVKGPVTATSNSGSSKVGRSTAKAYLGLVATGDASIEAAAEEAGINEIHHVDFESTNILGLYASYTVVVYGE